MADRYDVDAASASPGNEDEAVGREAPDPTSPGEAPDPQVTELSFVVLGALVAYRATTFVTTDSLTRPWRLRVARRFPPTEQGPHPVTVLVHCGRCIGFWLAGVTVAVLRAVYGDSAGPPWPLAWLAVAGAVTLLVSVAP